MSHSLNFFHPLFRLVKLLDVEINKYAYMSLWSIGLVVEVLISNSRDPGSKPWSRDSSKVNLVFHPSEVDQSSTRDSWELNGKK